MTLFHRSSILVSNGFFRSLGGWFTFSSLAIAIGASAAVDAGVSVYEGSENRSAISKQQDLLASLQYQPIDIAALTKTAQETAATNAANSLKLEQQLTPSVAALRTTLPAQVASQLKSLGYLPPDVRNAATTGALTGAGTSGLLGAGGAVPMTAATLGTTATNLQQLYQGEASNLLAANPLPASGLDPGSVASAIIANNANQNAFNIEKAGGQASLTNALTQANTGEASGIAGAANNAVSGLYGLNYLSALKGLSTGTGSTAALTSGTTNPLSAAQLSALSSLPNQMALGGAPVISV